MTWLRSLIAVLHRIPRLLRFELAERQRHDGLLRYLGAETATATWICALHGDAWRRADGTMRRLVGGSVLPLSVADAEDLHGYSRRRGEASW